MTKKKTSRISVQVSEKTMEDLDIFLLKTNKSSKNIKVTKSDVVREAVVSYIKSGSGPIDEERTNDSLLRKSRNLKNDGMAAKKSGSFRRSKKLFLAAASKELEALSMLEDPNENTLRSTIIEVLLMLKEATGYKRLPEVSSYIIQKELEMVEG